MVRVADCPAPLAGSLACGMLGVAGCVVRCTLLSLGPASSDCQSLPGGIRVGALGLFRRVLDVFAISHRLLLKP
jgi:hypothetical protein